MNRPIRNESSVKSFNEVALQKIIRDKQKFNAAFVSYRTVGNFEDGIINVGKEGLKIVVANGAPGPAGLVLAGIDALCKFDRGQMQQYIRDSEEEATQKLSMAQGKITIEETFDVLVFYLGLTGFEEALKTVGGLKITFPSLAIVGVTCDCDLSKKRVQVAKLVESDVINYFVVDSGCGGYGAMSQIVHELIRIWPQRVSLQA